MSAALTYGYARFGRAHADVDSFSRLCDGDERGRLACAAARVWTGGARADIGMYPLSVRHMSTVSVLLMLPKCWYIIYHALHYSEAVQAAVAGL